MKRPVLDGAFCLPTKTEADRSLIFGAGLFGIGWGIAGLCPGPAVASLAFAMPQTIAFMLAMLVGVISYDRLFVTLQRRQVTK